MPEAADMILAILGYVTQEIGTAKEHQCDTGKGILKTHIMPQ